MLDVRPLEGMPGCFKPAVELLSQDQCKEAAEDMSPYGFISLMEGGSCVEDGLDVPEGMYHLPELLVLQGHLLGRKTRIGLEHPLSVKAGILFDLGHVDGGEFFADLEIPAIPLIADEALWTFGLELLPERLKDVLPVLGILPGLFGVETDNVAILPHTDFLDLQRGRVLGGFSFGVDNPVPACSG